MSTNRYDRWYIVPSVTTTVGSETVQTPKYADRDGIDGFAGQTVGRDALSNYAGLLQTHPDIETWYLVRIYGAWSVLNEISVRGDTRNLATNASDVAAVLNQRLKGLDRSASSWDRSFRLGL